MREKLFPVTNTNLNFFFEMDQFHFLKVARGRRWLCGFHVLLSRQQYEINGSWKGETEH